MQLHLDFLAYLQMLQFLMFSNLAASHVLGSHPLSLDSWGTSLYCLPVPAGTEPSLDLSSPLLGDLLVCLGVLVIFFPPSIIRFLMRKMCINDRTPPSCADGGREYPSNTFCPRKGGREGGRQG